MKRLRGNQTTSSWSSTRPGPAPVRLLGPLLGASLCGSGSAFAASIAIDPPPARVQPLGPAAPGVVDFARNAATEIEAFSPLARLLNEANKLVRARQFRPAYRLLSPATDLYAEFAAIAAQQLPPGARKTLSRRLDSLTRVKNQPDPVYQVNAMVGFGYDDHINVNTTTDSWLLGDATAVTPPPQAGEESLFLTAGAGVRNALAINGRLQWISGLGASTRNHPSAHTADQDQIDVSTGFVYRHQCNQFKVLGQAQYLAVDRSGFRNAFGVVGQWQCDLSAQRQLGVFAQRFEFRFDDDDQLDAARQSLGVSFAELFPAISNTMLLSTVHTGREYSKQGQSNLSYDYAGIRVMLITPITGQLSGSVGIQYEHRRFDRPEPLFGITREDQQTEFTLGLQREITSHWTLEPQLVLTSNRSSLTPSDYSRTQAQLVARYRLN